MHGVGAHDQHAGPGADRAHTNSVCPTEQHAHIRTPDYERLSVEIHTLAIAYDTLVDAKYGTKRSDAKP